MPRLSLAFFASFQATLDGAPLTQLRSTRIQALLTYLALEAERPHTRDALAALFWPDEAETVAKQNLRQALYQLRQALGEQGEAEGPKAPFVLQTRDTVQFNTASDYTLDVRDFLAHLGRQEFEAALVLYQGELLPSLSSGSVLFEEWLALRRERLHIAALDALDHVTQQALEKAEFLRARDYARRQLALEPWREEAHRQLMLALARAGERHAALAQYEICRSVLAAEVGVEPDDETQQLADKIRLGRVEGQGNSVAVTQALSLPARPASEQAHGGEEPNDTNVDWGEAPDSGALYGRAGEVATLRHWLMVEGCRLVTLLGMGGIGKTTLAIHVARQLTPHFAVVIWRSLLNAPPLGDLLDGWLAQFSRQQANPVAQSLDTKVNLLFRYLREQRCLLILDNAESIMAGGERAGSYRPGAEEYGHFFKRMGESSHQSALLLTSREQPQEVARLLRETPLVRTLVVEGLSADAGQAILRQQGVENPSAQASELVQRYSGNPLALMLVAETLEELYDGDLAAFLASETPIFDDIRDVLDQHYARLSELERDVLLWLALEREPISIQQLSENLRNRLPKHQLLATLNSLRRRALLEKTAESHDQAGTGGFALQNVVNEYLIEVIIERLCEEIESHKPALLKSHALLRAQAKEYVRQSQLRLILKPLAERLRVRAGAQGLAAHMRALLDELRNAPDRLANYAGGNLLNLAVASGAEMAGHDFSHLAVWQADLQNVALPALNLSQSDLAGSLFTDSFGALSSVGFSPDGAMIAAGTTSGEIRLWRTVDGQALGTLEGHTNYLFSTLFSPDGALLFSGSDDGTVRVWDVHALGNGGAQPGILPHTMPHTVPHPLLHTLRHHRRGVWRLALTTDGRYLASASGDRSIEIWRLPELSQEPELLHTLHGHSQGVRGLAFRSDGALLASGSNDGAIHLWHVASGKLIAILSGHTLGVWAVAFSHDGQWLASGSDDHTVRLWNLAKVPARPELQDGPLAVLADQASRLLAGHGGAVTAVAFSPDGTQLVSGSHDQSIRLWDIARGTTRQTLHGHQDEITGVVFDPTGRSLASSSLDRSVRLWDTAQAQPLRTLQGHRQGVMSATFAPSGNRLATACQDHKVRLWDYRTHQLVAMLQGHTKEVHTVAFSPDGKQLASGGVDHDIRLWNAESGTLAAVLRGHQRWVRGVVFSPNGKLLASCSNDWSIRLWDATSGALYHTLQAPESVWAISFSPDGNTLASAGTERVVHLWQPDAATPFMSLHGHTNWITSLAFSADGTLLASGSGDQSVRLWDVKSGELINTLVGHSAWVYGVAFAPDGRRLASCSADRTVCVWDVASGQTLHTLRGHSNEVRSVAFSADGQGLASGSLDESVRLWQVQSGVMTQALHAPRPYEGMLIAGATGLTHAQRTALKALGAVE